MMQISPQHTYVHLSGDGQALQLPGGDAFWTLPEAQLMRYGEGWLVSEFECTADWPRWEMHPEGDELVYVLSGAVEMLLERPDGVERVALQGGGAVVVPRGVWHTARVSRPSRMLHVTRGAGTQHRDVQA